MTGAKLPILTITNKLYYRDDGLYVYSSTDGQLDVIADVTAKVTAPTVELEATTAITLDGNTTLGAGHTLDISAGDVTRQYTRYISGASGYIPTGYTRCPSWTEIIDDGIAILSGRSGNIYPRLPVTPSIGKTVTCVYIDSGQGSDGAYTAKLSGSSIKTGTKSGRATNYYVTFTYPGESVTLTNNGSSYFFIHPSGQGAGPALSTS